MVQGKDNIQRWLKHWLQILCRPSLGFFYNYINFFKLPLNQDYQSDPIRQIVLLNLTDAHPTIALRDF